MSRHKDSTLQIRIDEAELERARQRAAQQGISLSTVVRRLLRRFVADPEIALPSEEDERTEYRKRD